MKADLHCHSHFSDGQHPPQFLIDRAVANHVTHLAITDHDCLLNCSELTTPPGLTLVPAGNFRRLARHGNSYHRPRHRRRVDTSE